MLVLAWFVLAAVFGRDLLTNPAFGMFYVWWWVGLVPLSVLFGPVWKAISPVRTINTLFARASGSDPDRGLYDYPARLGLWPAAVGLFAFVWIELVYPFSTELGPVRLWAAGYLALMLLGGALFGSTFYEKADPFEVYSSLCAKLSVWGRRDGVLVVRSPLANLDTVAPLPGLVAVVGVLFGSTAFDSFRDSLTWIRFTQESSVSTYVLDNLALLAFCVGVAVILAIGSAATGTGPGTRRRDLPALFAHSVVPIIVGYILAHYVNYLVEVGWDTLVLASDPLSNGSELARHRRPRPDLLALLPPDPARLDQGRGGRGRPRAGRGRRPRTGGAGAAEEAPGDRSAADAVRDDRLHRRRALPALRRLSRGQRRRDARRAPGPPRSRRPRPGTGRPPGPGRPRRGRRAGSAAR